MFRQSGVLYGKPCTYNANRSKKGISYALYALSNYIPCILPYLFAFEEEICKWISSVEGGRETGQAIVRAVCQESDF